MEDVTLFNQGRKLIRSRKQALVGTLAAARCGRDKVLLLAHRHWPTVRSCSVILGRVVLMVMMQWWDSAVRGFFSLISFGPVTLFVIIWSCFISSASASGVVYVLLSLGAAGFTVCCLGYTPGLFIIGLFGILIMWIYGNFWITGILLILGGYMFTLNHARILIFMSTAYAVYTVNAHVGWLGVFLSLNLSFFSNDFLNKLLHGYDVKKEATPLEEQKKSEPSVKDFSGDCDYHPPTQEAEKMSSNKSSYDKPGISTSLNTPRGGSCSKAVNTDSTSLVEIKRIMSSSSHYETLGFSRNISIDSEILKREYRMKARLVHPDKNMGSPLASESFKKLQSAYEVLSDSMKKNIYDDQLRKEESGRISQRSRGAFYQEGVDYRSEESRRIECTKCGNSHIWICTNRTKTRARWCQDCSQYHQARDGDGWVEHGCSFLFSEPRKVEIPRAFVCAESKIFDASEWAICQGMACRPNTHLPSFHVNMIGSKNTVHRCDSTSGYACGLDAEMMPEDEFDLWFQQALASGLFSESPKRRKSWSPFKLQHRGTNPRRRSQ